MSEPVLDKRPAHPWDNAPMTWTMFIALRAWAQEVSDKEGFPVYLVGSVQYKEVPRDIDVSIIMPTEEYERRYGHWPEEPSEQNEYMIKVWEKNIRHYFEGRKVLGNDVSFDLKFCPNHWFTDKPKLLLAEPQGGKQV